MTLEELIQSFRLQADDVETPYQWEDEEITRFLNEAEREACQRAYLIYDEVTPDATELSMEEGQNLAQLHESVFQVDRVTADGVLIARTNREALDRATPLWGTVTGTPTQWFTVEGIANDVLYVVPKPTGTVELKLSVYRTPLVQMESSSDEPEIHPRFHFRLIDWALSLGYRKEDEETKDMQKAERHEAAFVRSFGQSVDENVRRKWRRTTPNVVQMNPGW